MYKFVVILLVGEVLSDQVSRGGYRMLCSRHGLSECLVLSFAHRFRYLPIYFELKRLLPVDGDGQL